MFNHEPHYYPPRRLPRDASRDAWRFAWRVYRNEWREYAEGRMPERMSHAEAIKKHAVDGKIGVHWTSMDCDCAYGEGVSVITAHPIAIQRWLDRFYDDAEGPQTAYLTKPERMSMPTRDLALEAHEDGHDHVVYLPR